MTSTLRLFLLTTMSLTLSLGCGDKDTTDSGTTDDSATAGRSPTGGAWCCRPRAVGRATRRC